MPFHFRLGFSIVRPPLKPPLFSIFAWRSFHERMKLPRHFWSLRTSFLPFPLFKSLLRPMPCPRLVCSHGARLASGATVICYELWISALFLMAAQLLSICSCAPGHLANLPTPPPLPWRHRRWSKVFHLHFRIGFFGRSTSLIFRTQVQISTDPQGLTQSGSVLTEGPLVDCGKSLSPTTEILIPTSTPRRMTFEHAPYDRVVSERGVTPFLDLARAQTLYPGFFFFFALKVYG